MAAAEARAAWQQSANRRLVQEDAKRAPKLACCPSSVPEYNSSNELGNASSTEEYSVFNFSPLTKNVVKANLSPETKWWVQLQSNVDYQNDFTCELLNKVDLEAAEKCNESTVPTTKLDDNSFPVNSIDFVIEKEKCYIELPCLVSTAFMKQGPQTMSKEINMKNSSAQLPVEQKKVVADFLFKEAELMDFNPIDQLISKKSQKASPNTETPWTGINKSEPWWRIADEDELALLIAQKSLGHIDNCDLPKPNHIVHIDAAPSSSPENLNPHMKSKLHMDICYAHEFSHDACSYGSSGYRKSFWGEVADTLYDSENLNSITQDHGHNDQTETNKTSENDPSRAQMLEALRHSQTRARKAEMEAQKANDEKEHMIKLFFRDASHLFVYKQWFRMLQVERLCLQLKFKEYQLAFPWMPQKGRLLNKDKVMSKGAKKNKCNVCNCAILFAVGLGLAGVGLLLGWTFGWLFLN